MSDALRAHARSRLLARARTYAQSVRDRASEAVLEEDARELERAALLWALASGDACPVDPPRRHKSVSQDHCPTGSCDLWSGWECSACKAARGVAE